MLNRKNNQSENELNSAVVFKYFFKQYSVLENSLIYQYFYIFGNQNFYLFFSNFINV